MITLIIAPTVVLAAIYIRVRLRAAQIGPFLPEYFLLGILFYALGASVVSLQRDTADALDVATMAWLALDSAILGSIVFVILFGKQYKKFRFDRYVAELFASRLELFGIYVGLAFSTFVCLVFVYLVFSNDVVGAILSSIASSGDSSLLDARKAITSGVEGYFAPGFVKQFRDNLIPIFLIALMAQYAPRRRTGDYRVIFAIVFVIAFAAMLVAGIRSNIVFLLLSLFVARYLIAKSAARLRPTQARARKNSMLGPVLLILVFYGFLTFLLGRLTGGDSLIGDALGVVSNLLHRVIVAVPSENIATYSYWGRIGPTFGQSWMDDLSSVLPGVNASALSNQLHYLHGGSDQGNSPLGLPADVWFAWGWIGIALVPFIYSIAFGTLDLLLLSRSSPVFFGAKIFLIFAVLKIYSPFGFMLYGGGAVAVLIFCVTTVRYPKGQSVIGRLQVSGKP